jgi:hypothetical protein
LNWFPWGARGQFFYCTGQTKNGVLRSTAINDPYCDHDPFEFGDEAEGLAVEEAGEQWRSERKLALYVGCRGLGEGGWILADNGMGSGLFDGIPQMPILSVPFHQGLFEAQFRCCLLHLFASCWRCLQQVAKGCHG